MNYGDMIAAGLKGRLGMGEWMAYLARLSKFQQRQKELMKDMFKRHKGLSNAELARRVLPVLQNEGLCEGLPEYVVQGY